MLAQCAGHHRCVGGGTRRRPLPRMGPPSVIAVPQASTNFPPCRAALRRVKGCASASWGHSALPQDQCRVAGMTSSSPVAAARQTAMVQVTTASQTARITVGSIWARIDWALPCATVCIHVTLKFLPSRPKKPICFRPFGITAAYGRWGCRPGGRARSTAARAGAGRSRCGSPREGPVQPRTGVGRSDARACRLGWNSYATSSLWQRRSS